ncbi:MAG TPA: hypothetical protein VFG15_06155 [Amycolatopsis sp.]|nr:hypothetical protein [Amycolatopsis sp.]
MPSRDPDDGEIDDVDEFLGSLGEVEYDDVLLSLLGDGGNLDVAGDVVDQQLANALSGWRDDGDREPARDEAIGQKHPGGGDWPPTTGGTVSIQDHIAQLRALASSDLARSGVAGINEDTRARAEQAAGILGDHPGLQAIQAAAAEVYAAAGALEGVLSNLDAAIEDVASGIARG